MRSKATLLLTCLMVATLVPAGASFATLGTGGPIADDLSIDLAVPLAEELLTPILGDDASADAYTGQFIWPVTGTVSGQYYDTRSSGLHRAIDIATGGVEGRSVYAAASGVVTVSTWSSCGGNWIEIDHGNGYRTRYLHLLARQVNVGNSVGSGQQIATSGGRTGTGDTCTTGPHLHFEVRQSDNGAFAQQFIPGAIGAPITARALISYPMGLRQVNTASLTIRDGPGTSYAAVGAVQTGERYVRYGDYGNGWSVLNVNGRWAWASNTYLTPVSGTVQRVNVDVLNVRSCASTNCGVIGTTYFGQEYYRVATGSDGTNTWYQIYYDGSGGQNTGWIAGWLTLSVGR